MEWILAEQRSLTYNCFQWQTYSQLTAAPKWYTTLWGGQRPSTPNRYGLRCERSPKPDLEVKDWKDLNAFKVQILAGQKLFTYLSSPGKRRSQFLNECLDHTISWMVYKL